MNLRINQLIVDFTRVCNSHCKLCHIWKTKNPPTLKAKYIRKLLSQLDSIRIFYVSGGEPYINPEIFDIAQALLDYRPEALWMAATNSIWKGTADAIKKIGDMGVKLGIVDLSLEGNREQHDYIRGTKGNYDTVLYTMKKLQEYNIKFQLVSITDNGVAEAKRLGFENMKGRMRFGERVNMPHKKKILYKVENCQGAKADLCCTPDGDIYPCEDYRPELYLGNIKTMDLKDMPFKKVRKYIESGKCSPCQMSCWTGDRTWAGEQ